MTKFKLTHNEGLAAIALVKHCLQQIGGTRPSDLEENEMTWCNWKVLVQNNWGTDTAHGLWGSLTEKGVVTSDGDHSRLTTAAWKWLDMNWEL